MIGVISTRVSICLPLDKTVFHSLGTDKIWMDVFSSGRQFRFMFDVF